MQDDVGAEIERVLQIRRGKGVVYTKEDLLAGLLSPRFGFRGECGDIHDVHQRIRWRLRPDEFRLLIDVRPDSRCILHVHEMEFDTHLFEDLREEPVGAAVHIVGSDDLVAGDEQTQYGIRSRYPATETQAVFAILDMRQRGLESKTRWILRTGILITFVHSRRALHISGCLIDRGHDGTRGW